MALINRSDFFNLSIESVRDGYPCLLLFHSTKWKEKVAVSELNDTPNIKTSLQTISVFGLMYLKLRDDSAQGTNLDLPRFLQGMNSMAPDAHEPSVSFFSAFPGGCMNPLNLWPSLLR